MVDDTTGITVAFSDNSGYYGSYTNMLTGSYVYDSSLDVYKNTGRSLHLVCLSGSIIPLIGITKVLMVVAAWVGSSLMVWRKAVAIQIW